MQKAAETHRTAPYLQTFPRPEVSLAPPPVPAMKHHVHLLSSDILIDTLTFVFFAWKRDRQTKRQTERDRE